MFWVTKGYTTWHALYNRSIGRMYSEWFWEKVGLVAYDSEIQAKYTWYILDIINYQQTNGDSTVPFATYHLASTTTIMIEHVLSLETLIHKRGAARDVEWNLGVYIHIYI